MAKWKADRRELFLCSGAFGLLAMIPRPLIAQTRRRGLGDAHVHLFNASDLPIGGFIELVLMPYWARSLPVVAHSLARSVAIARRFAVTAEEELGAADTGNRPSLFAEQLAADIAGAGELTAARRTEIVEQLARIDQPQAVTDLRESHVALALALQGTESESGAEAARRLLENPQSTSAFEDVVNVSPELVFRMAEGDRNALSLERRAANAPLGVRRLFEERTSTRGRCPNEPASQLNGSWLERMSSTIKWASDMTRSRQAQLDAYLAHMVQPGDPPPLLINLLVDYDRWLNDRPSGASSHGRQIALWTQLSARNRDRAEIKTFAGFDPLKHAEDRLRGDTSYWTTLQQAFRSGRSPQTGSASIYGFKLYPPMGFRPGTNVPADFRTNDRAMAYIRSRWSRPPWSGRELHDELNISLEEFYSFCESEGAPILAHASHSNDAGRCWGDRANPQHWVDVIRAHPRLRLCLGHFAEASDFIEGMRAVEAGEPVLPKVWALHGLTALLRLNRELRAQVYADIGYMSELLIEPPSAGARLAVEFFRRLGQYCDRYDPRCERLMFGSDWVMLGREVNHQRYLETVRFGIERAGWNSERRDNFLVNNLRRFLDLVAAS